MPNKQITMPENDSVIDQTIEQLKELGIKPIKPHCEIMRPYGYRFGNVDLIKTPHRHDLLNIFKDGYHYKSISIGKDNPHQDRIIWHIASHIEGNFGLPYDAMIIFSNDWNGYLSIYMSKSNKWWKPEHLQSFSNYLMGLRSLLDLSFS